MAVNSASNFWPRSCCADISNQFSEEVCNLGSVIIERVLPIKVSSILSGMSDIRQGHQCMFVLPNILTARIQSRICTLSTNPYGPIKGTTPHVAKQLQKR